MEKYRVKKEFQGRVCLSQGMDTLLLTNSTTSEELAGFVNEGTMAYLEIVNEPALAVVAEQKTK